MQNTAGPEEYLEEIRKEACSRCVERPPGGPPCGSLGKWCGVEHNLPELIDAVHDAHGHWMGPYCDSTERHVCEHCPIHDTSACPCPMDQLLVLVVQAVEVVDARRGRRAEALQLAATLPGREKPDVQGIIRAFEEAAGTWTGCDWPTRFGKAGLDLEGWSAAEAQAAAEEHRGLAEESYWRAASSWLTRVEQYARRAEEEARQAVLDATAGDWCNALKHAQWARACEFLTARTVWRGTPTTWQPLLRAVFAAMPDHPAPEAAAARDDLQAGLTAAALDRA
jgi:hypothetical protein